MLVRPAIQYFQLLMRSLDTRLQGNDDFCKLSIPDIVAVF